ncbi:unnamed protein product [Candida verbasci]|uniref:D-lactate dehydrogenase (cytochrome) n=1 Tax=Candida verbasci TaxID=1227364 RepID=A0A9W4TWF4_9ASCO|nr:unnamed protein product [Candida verbasci]
MLKRIPNSIKWGIIGTTVLSTSFIAYKYGKSTILKNPPENLFPKSSITKLEKLDAPKYIDAKDIPSVIDLIKQEIDNVEVKNDQPEIDHHTGNEFTTHKPLIHEKPIYIIYPKSTKEVSTILKICNEFKVPVVPFSGGSSLEGHFHSTRKGIVVDTSKMNKILEINDDDLDVKVQAGVNWQDLNQILEPCGLLFGTDCGPSGRIGGMIATNASGILASRYASTAFNVISITAVLPDGTIIKTKKRPRKSSAGYNLTNLFAGSEGTLGIVTEATLKVHPKPKSETVVVVQFPSISDSTKAVSQIFRSGIQPTAIELLDTNIMHCLNYSNYTTRKWLECPTLFFKIGGINDVVVNESVKIVKDITSNNNSSDFIFAENKEEGEELFSARKNAFYSMIEYGRNEIDPDCRIWVTDIAVPLSKLSKVLYKVHQMIKDSGFFSITLAHAGDGNFHADIFYKIEQRKEVEAMVNKFIELALKNEGTCTGEHGVGNAKRSYLLSELGDDTISLMRKLKLSIDPNRIMNPDKIFKIDPNDIGKY